VIYSKAKHGQSMLEYTFLVVCLVGAFLAMQFYVNRAMQGRLRGLADQISDRSYEPGVTTYSGLDGASGGMVLRNERQTITETRSYQPLSVFSTDYFGLLKYNVPGYVSASKTTIVKDETTQKGEEHTRVKK
jgi:hypothetical protein